VSATIDIPDNTPVTILFGPSGAGKTTVLRAIAGLERLTRGYVKFKGHSWTELTPQKRSMGYVFQDYALFPRLSVAENIAYGIRNSKDRETQVRRVAEAVQVADLLTRRPSELSGGQQQRVALARAVARKPELLLLDEPLSALDASTRTQVRAELSRLLRSLGIPAIVVTHDWEDALSWGDHLVVMNRGVVLQAGPQEQVFTQPAHPEVAAVVGVETVIAGHVKERQTGVALLQVGRAELYAADPGDRETEYFVCIRGENVILEKGPPSQSSARNHLAGRVMETKPLGALFRVTVDVGFELVALVTRQALADLELSTGAPVFAVFKASAVHLIPHSKQ